MTRTIMTSVLFTDLVDSTAVARRLGPARADEWRQTYFGLLREVVSANGGTEVKNLGDGLMVAFLSPSPALSCATGMQQAIERHNQSAGEALGLRIGVNAGEAVEEDGDYFGDTVVEAARLCAAATGGQILTTDLVRAMVGRRGPHSFRDVGALELKGIPEPVAAVEVLWEPMVVQASVPLPTALVAAAREASFGFCGRVGELEQLGETQRRAFAEPRLHTALVAGEAGIGKTSLIAQTASRAHNAGITVLLGHCDEDLTVPYQPWIEALSHLVRHLGTECVDVLSPLYRSNIARLVPALGGEGWASGDRVDSERLVLMHSVEMLLKETSAVTPMIVVLDDLHWADAASLQVLRHLVTSAESMAVLILCTYRHTDLGSEHPLNSLLADMHRIAGVERLRLSGLDDAETVELIATAAGHDLDQVGLELARTLRRETDGNPFFTGELLHHLGESGVFREGKDGHWALQGDFGAMSLPASVRDVVARRVSRLGQEAVRILSLASVIGRDFELETLAEVAARSEDEVLDVLEPATAAAVVRERDVTPGSYRFNHALIQRTLYEDLGAARRARTHQRIAEAIEAVPNSDSSRTAELARHWVGAIRPANLAKALHYLTRAADEALSSLAPDDAISWYKQALDLAGRQSEVDDSLRCRLLVGLGTAERHAGAPIHRETLLEAGALARQTEDPELQVAAVLAADRGFSGTSVKDEDWVNATLAALDAIGPADSRARARLLIVLSQEIDAREWERRRDLSAEALSVARRLDDDATLLAVLPVAYQHYGPEALERRLVETAEAISLAERIGHPLVGANALFHRIDACMQAADIDEVDIRLEEFATIARSAGLPLHLWQLHLTLSWRALLDGRCDDAEAEANAALELGTASGYAEAILAYGAQLLEIRRHQGRLEEMVEFLDQVEVEHDAAMSFGPMLAAVYSELGRMDEARPLFAKSAENEFRDIPQDEAWPAVMLSIANAATALGDLDACRIAYERLLPYERRVVAVYAVVGGAIARTLGRLATTLGLYDAAEAHLRVALELHERIRAPYWIACTELDLRDLLALRQAPGDETRAAELADSAQRITQAQGYLGLQTR